MTYRKRTYYTATQKALMWERWKDGWTLHEIASRRDLISAPDGSARQD
jgi:hypothetical protein